MRDIGTLIADDVESAIEMQIIRGNEKTATILERIYDDLRTMDGSQVHWRLEKLCDQNQNYSEILAQLIKSVGGSSSAKTGDEFVADFVFLLENLSTQEDGEVVPLHRK